VDHVYLPGSGYGSTGRSQFGFEPLIKVHLQSYIYSNICVLRYLAVFDMYIVQDLPKKGHGIILQGITVTGGTCVITPLPLISPNSKSQKPGIVLRARVEKKIPGPETEPQRKTKRGTAGVKHMRVGPRKYHGSPPNPKPYASPRSGCGGGG
jgi:hypothetical protein